VAKFKDSAGREYDVVFHVGTLARIRENEKIDPMWIFSTNEAERAKACDPVSVAVIVWNMVKASAEKQGVNRDAFFDTIGGENLQAAIDAMIEALISFSPSPRARELMRVAWANGKTLESKGLDLAEAMMTKAGSALGESLSSATDSLALSESTPTA
jgi:hypothetical protein